MYYGPHVRYLFHPDWGGTTVGILFAAIIALAIRYKWK
ncbi:hypothetical protein S2091_0074 [Solimicrobium silvestre]|uniref:Uncharacterized protein n=1 Tax=Solimicrobium silvestre TaxID=2099400 RepID=A0A2S9H4H0_9BURK|nr:hypothetical protein S2091_0074 [Solimicrobium silvestre]